MNKQLLVLGNQNYKAAFGDSNLGIHRHNMRSRNAFMKLLTLVCLVGSFDVLAEYSVVSGVVIDVYDGNTLTIKSLEKGTLKIRLANIDAPELNQPYGIEARQILSKCILLKLVKFKIIGNDSSDRKTAEIYSDSCDVEAHLVESGAAWFARTQQPNPILVKAELNARIAIKGVWASAAPVPPWEWRAQKRVLARPAIAQKIKELPRSKIDGVTEVSQEARKQKDIAIFLKNIQSFADLPDAYYQPDGSPYNGAQSSGVTSYYSNSWHSPYLIHTGPRGGLYYNNSSGNKQYVSSGSHSGRGRR